MYAPHYFIFILYSYMWTDRQADRQIDSFTYITEEQTASFLTQYIDI